MSSIYFNKYNLKKNFRFICPKCLRTFLNHEELDGCICWKCNKELIVIKGKKDGETK